MSIEGPSRNAALSSAGYLTHDQAIALLDAVARLLDAAETESGPAGSHLTPSWMPTLVAAMRTVGIDAALIHAYEETGVVVSEGSEDLWSASDLRRWEAAIEGYRGHRAPCPA
jgi:hypothetical protein